MQYVKTLMEVMPKICRLPRHEYGSPGKCGLCRVVASLGTRATAAKTIQSPLLTFSNTRGTNNIE